MIFLIPVFFIFKDKLPELTFDFLKKETNIENQKKGTKDSKIGKVMDSFNGVNIYFNGRVRNVSGRNKTKDGYNLGLKYQCVEFIKRYYYLRFGHKMPDSYGHAKDFYDRSLKDGSFNSKRGLYQYSNPSRTMPQKEDILIYGPATFNKFGHIAIISKSKTNQIESVSQNLGVGNGTRRTYNVIRTPEGKYKIDDPYIIGWLSRSK